MKRALTLLGLMIAWTLPALSAPAESTPGDSWQWLEDVTGKKPLEWVARHNARSEKALAQSPEFKAMNQRFLEVLNSNDKIPYVNKIGEHYYNLWRDQSHDRGLWRRTTLAEYRKDRPAWDTVLDLDALGKVEKENWVWHGAQSLPPDDRRCIVLLSRGGADAQVAREFDLGTKSFVRDGFVLPEAKSSIAWHDLNSVYVGTDFGAGSMTTSGYPRIVKRWTRGTPLSAATTVFEGKNEDVGVFASHDFTPGFERDFVYRAITFFTNELYLQRDGQWVRIDKPDDAEAGTHREWLLIRLRTDWKVGDRTWPAGALLAARLEDFLTGKRDFDLLFEPTERVSLDSYSTMSSAIVLNTLDNVKNRLYRVRREHDQWTRTPIAGLPEFGSIEATPVDARVSDDFFLTVTDFLSPTTFSLESAAGGMPEKLKQSPSFFDASGLEVTQHEATSKDGTRIPYFQVSPKNLAADGNAPTLLTGYGGFEIPEMPYYSAIKGRGWLEKGGVLVVANIRGGGEFGPQWHQAAIKANRPRAYEDFIAVAEDLIQRKITTPKRLGCIGGSNGGLLVGNMLTMRPDLFGAIVCESPLLDMRRYHKLLAGASWMGEYGNPDDPAEWEFIRTFSPYHNVQKGVSYPPTLFTTSTRDDRVHPGHARKMMARMEEQGHDALYYENVEGGHAGAADNKQQAFMSSMAYRFLWMMLASDGDHRASAP